MIRFKWRKKSWNKIAIATVNNNNERAYAMRQWILKMMSLKTEVGGSAKTKYFVFMIRCSGQWNMVLKISDDTTHHVSAFFFISVILFISSLQMTNLFDRNWLEYSAVISTGYGNQCRLTDFSILLTVFAQHADRAKLQSHVEICKLAELRSRATISILKNMSLFICNWFARWTAVVSQLKQVRNENSPTFALHCTRNSPPNYVIIRIDDWHGQFVPNNMEWFHLHEQMNASRMR